MEDFRESDVAAAVLELVTMRSVESARVLDRRVLDGLVDAVWELLGLPAAAAQVTQGIVQAVVIAGPERSRAALLAGFDHGPGADCARSGGSIVCEELSGHPPGWPSFVAAAAASGAAAAWALPIRRDAEVFGALLVLGEPDAPFGLSMLGVLAGAAAVAFAQASDRHDDEREVRQLRSALQNQITVEQANGLIAGLTGLDIADASALLRGHAQRHQRSLAETAAAVLRHEVPLEPVIDRL